MPPPICLACSTHLAEPVEVFHNDIRGRDNRGEEKLMDENEMRPGDLQPAALQVEMIEVARRCGASAQFAGSGGTIIGLYKDEAMLEALRQKLGALECRVIVPRVA